MNIPYYQLDAFTTSKPFSGNPAGVCTLENWLSDDILQNIAMENNLSETAFIVEQEGYYDLRWFTPEVEVDLCGHATLAASSLILEYLNSEMDSVKFKYNDGYLSAEKSGNMIEINFPSRPPVKCTAPELLIEAMGKQPGEIYLSRDYVLVYDTEEDIASMNPNMNLLSQVDCFGVIITAKGNSADFVSRYFAPGCGVPEDPVTGSAHCNLIPYWSNKLNSEKMHAIQLSKRGGEIHCTYDGDRVFMSGKCTLFLKGEISIHI
ncbi:MAG TPA: PhzF family phenazine biosynthesis protein [Victivallales bacterium]|nr:PhzF family phenazine biosynthesis protein [Victivallales bacterium]